MNKLLKDIDYLNSLSYFENWPFHYIRDIIINSYVLECRKD